jgi:hypothetical protein
MDISDAEKLKEAMEIVESRIPWGMGRRITTILVSLIVTATTVWLCDFLYHKLVPVGQFILSFFTGGRPQGSISYVLAQLLIVILSGLIVYWICAKAIEIMKLFVKAILTIEEEMVGIQKEMLASLGKLTTRVSALEGKETRQPPE